VNYRRYYEQQRNAGAQYETFVAEQLRRFWGKEVKEHRTMQDQLRYGDLRVDGVDVEVKFDDQFAKTTRLYIEIDERTQRGVARLIPSGIYATSSAKFYLIGDGREAYLFDRQELREWQRRNRPPIVTTEYRSGHGFLLHPVDRNHLKQDYFQWMNVGL
jgi:hypothetical protein